MDNLQERIEQAANAIHKAVTQLTGYGANNTTYLAETKQLIRDMAARIGELERVLNDITIYHNEQNDVSSELIIMAKELLRKR